MESYELNKVLNENDIVVLKSTAGDVRIEKMQDQWDMYVLGGALLIVFDSMFCESATDMELLLGKECVASFDPTVFEVA